MVNGNKDMDTSRKDDVKHTHQISCVGRCRDNCEGRKSDLW